MRRWRCNLELPVYFMFSLSMCFSDHNPDGISISRDTHYVRNAVIASRMYRVM